MLKYIKLILQILVLGYNPLTQPDKDIDPQDKFLKKRSLNLNLMYKILPTELFIKKNSGHFF